jgi:hypothetical protein
MLSKPLDLVLLEGLSKLIKTMQDFKVFTEATMKNAVFWDDTPCGSCKNRRFGGT